MWQAKGLNVHFSPGLAKEDAGVEPGCLGLWPYWGREGPLCASAILASIASQASRRTCRKVEAEVRASRGARNHNGSAVARILRGRLPRPGPALQWTRNQCKKRRSLCDRHRVRALERAKARAGGQGWAGRSVGRRRREVSQSQFAVAVTVRSRCRRRDRNCKAGRPCGSTYTRDRTGTGTRVQTQAQTQAQGRRVGHRILAVWDETRLYEVCRACKRVAAGGVLCCSYPSTYMRGAYGSARLIGDLAGGEGREEGRADGGQEKEGGCTGDAVTAGRLGCDQCRFEQERQVSCPRSSFSTWRCSQGGPARWGGAPCRRRWCCACSGGRARAAEYWPSGIGARGRGQWT